MDRVAQRGRAYVERLRRAGKDASLTEYAGAYHVFDWAALKTVTKHPEAKNLARCRIEEASEGRLVNSDTITIMPGFFCIRLAPVER